MEVPYILDIDLMKLTFFSQFVAENFVRCLFRYYPHLSEYVKEIFLAKVLEEERMIQRHYDPWV